MGTWLITGAGGFIGYHLCRRLLEEGEQVVGVDSLDPGYAVTLLHARLSRLAAYPRFRLEVADVAEAGLAEGLLSAHLPETVVHLAARTGVRNSSEEPLAYTRTNVLGFVALLDACRRHGVGHVVYASSSSVYGDGAALPSPEDDPAGRPISLYAATKRSSELVAHSYSHLHGLPTTGLRLFTAYGPWGRPDMAYYRFAEAILADRPVEIYGDGSARRDFTYVDDVVEGILRVAPRPPSATGGDGSPWAVYNLGRGRHESVSRLLALLEELLERPARRCYHPAASGDAAVTLADGRSLAEATGFTPSVPLDEGLERFVEWFLAYRSSVPGRPLAHGGAGRDVSGRTEPSGRDGHGALDQRDAVRLRPA